MNMVLNISDINMTN